MVTLSNCGTSFFAGFVIFAIIGFMAEQLKMDIQDAAVEGKQPEGHTFCAIFSYHPDLIKPSNLNHSNVTMFTVCRPICQLKSSKTSKHPMEMDIYFIGILMIVMVVLSCILQFSNYFGSSRMHVFHSSFRSRLSVMKLPHHIMRAFSLLINDHQQNSN